MALKKYKTDVRVHLDEHIEDYITWWAKDKNGEYIMWLNDEKVVEIYGPNMAVGEGIKYRIGLYRWLNKKSKGPTSLTIKEFSYSENCEEVLDSSKCNYNTDEIDSYIMNFNNSI